MDTSASKHLDVENSSNSVHDSSPTENSDISSKQGVDVESRCGCETTCDYEDCSTSCSYRCEHMRTFLRNRPNMTGERTKRKRWRWRFSEAADYVSDLSLGRRMKQEASCLKSDAGINVKEQQEDTKTQLILTETSNCEDDHEIALGLEELATRGMTAEVVDEISTMFPDFFTQNSVLLFQLKQVEFLELVSARDHDSALKVACLHLGPLAANNPSLLKTLKETLLVLLQPDGNALGKELPLNALATSLQVAICKRLGIEEPQLMKLMRATLCTHAIWFKLQICKDRFESLLKIDSLKEVNTSLLGTTATKSKSKKDGSTHGSSQVTTSSSTVTSEDGSKLDSLFIKRRGVGRKRYS